MKDTSLKMILGFIWAIFVIGGVFMIVQEWRFFRQKPETAMGTVIHFNAEGNHKHGKGQPTFLYKAKDSIEYTFVHEHDVCPCFLYL